MFNVRLFIDHECGGVAGLIETLERAYGRAPKPATVQKWRYRNSMPAEHLAAYLAAVEGDDGKSRVLLSEYVKGKTKCSTTRRMPTGWQASVFD